MSMAHRTVKEIMLPLDEYAKVSAEETIRDALRALDKAQLGRTSDRHHHRAVLVLDEWGEVVGKLSHWAILRKLEPKILSAEDRAALDTAGLSPEFIHRLEEGGFSHFGDLTALSRRAARVKAKDAMVSAGESIDENASLTAAVHQLITTHAQSILVMREGKTVGILRLSDVFEAVADLIRDIEDEAH
jgi:CBS domain-containing protein